jgi:hypothetical protein
MSTSYSQKCLLNNHIKTKILAISILVQETEGPLSGRQSNIDMTGFAYIKAHCQILEHRVIQCADNQRLH